MVKLLFLPHCLRKDLSQEIRSAAEGLGYETYIAPGGSRVKQIFESYGLAKVEKVVGVACKAEIGLMLDYADHVGFSRKKIYHIPLSEDGCRRTTVELSTVLERLKIFKEDLLDHELFCKNEDLILKTK